MVIMIVIINNIFFQNIKLNIKTYIPYSCILLYVGYK